jgi:DSF synthase
MNPAPRPCFNPVMVDEIARSERLLESHQGWINDRGRPQRVDYVVFGSRVPGVFNLGGDLNMFIQAIMRKDRELLADYAHLCVENIHRRANGFGAQVTSIALVQGKALGGGFECALASDVIIAERSATFSLPEVFFNLFPGMGALSFLARRIGLKKAEDLIMSGQVFTAKEMHDIGIVDELAEDGLGLETTRRLIIHRQRKQNAYRSMQLAKRYFQPLELSELKSIVDVWIDAALNLETRDLRMMARLVKAQDRLAAGTAEDAAEEAMYGQAPLQAVSNG